MRRSLLVALTPDRVIGRGNALPWRLSADLQRFRQLTMGHHLIMGRRTFEAIGRPLPGRTSIVVTRQSGLAESLPAATLVARSLEEAFSLAAADSEPFVIGGGEIYQLALPLVDRIYATWVLASLTGDTFFPAFPDANWHLVGSHDFPVDAKNEFATRFCVYDRLEP